MEPKKKSLSNAFGQWIRKIVDVIKNFINPKRSMRILIDNTQQNLQRPTFVGLFRDYEVLKNFIPKWLGIKFNCPCEEYLQGNDILFFYGYLREESPSDFYEKIFHAFWFDWISTEKSATIVIYIEYINSANMVELFGRIDELLRGKKNATILWLHKDDDIPIKDLGRQLASQRSALFVASII